MANRDAGTAPDPVPGTKPGRGDEDGRDPRVRGIVVALIAAQFLLSISNNTPSPVVALYAIQLGASIGLASVAVASSGLMTGMTVLIFGMLADRIGRNRLLYASALLSIIGPLTSYFATDLPTLVATRLLTGLAPSMAYPVTWALNADLSPRGGYGRAMGNTGAALQMGAFIGPVVGGFAGAAYGYRSAFVFASLISVLALLMVHVTVTRLRKIGLTRRVGSGTGREERAPIELRNFVAGGVCNFVQSIAQSSYTILLPAYLVVQLRETNSAGVGILVGTAAVGQAVGRYFLSSVSDRYGRKIPIVAGLVGFGVSLGLILVSTNFAFLLLISAAAGISGSFIFPAAGALVIDSTPIDRRTTAMGSYAVFGTLGSSVGGSLLGFAAQGWGFEAAYAVLAGMQVATAVSMVGWIRKRRASQEQGG